MSFRSSPSSTSGGRVRLRARMRTLGRANTTLGGQASANSEDARQVGRPCISVTLIDEEGEEGAAASQDASQRKQRQFAGATSGPKDEILMHREHLVETDVSMKQSRQVSRKRTRVGAGLLQAPSLRFKTLEALFKYIELSCPGTPSLPDPTSVDLFVDVDALGMSRQAALSLLELADYRDKLAPHLIHITAAEWHPVIADHILLSVLQRWVADAEDRRSSKLISALRQITRFFHGQGQLSYPVLRLQTGEAQLQTDQGPPAQDVHNRHAQGLHELWEIALQAENHVAVTDDHLELVLDLFERAERNSPVQTAAAGALQALALTTTDSSQRLKALQAPQRAFQAIHSNIANLVATPPPRPAVLLLRMLLHFASDPECHHAALDQLGFFAACIQSGASTQLCAAIIGVYLRVLNVSSMLSSTLLSPSTTQAPLPGCEIQAYSSSELEGATSGMRRRRSKKRRSTASKLISVGKLRVSANALGEFLREAISRAAELACADTACKLGAAVLAAQFAYGAEIQDFACPASECTGRVHVRVDDDPDAPPMLHPLKDLLLTSKAVPSGITGLGRWALAAILRNVEKRTSPSEASLRRLRALIAGGPNDPFLDRAPTFASISSVPGAGLEDEDAAGLARGDTNSSTPSCRGYLADAYAESMNLLASDKMAWRSRASGKPLPANAEVHVLETLIHVINACAVWAFALRKQCVSDRDVFMRFRAHPSAVQDRDVDAVFCFLAHVLAFAHEGWFRGFLEDLHQAPAPETRARIDHALHLAVLATESLLYVPQVAARVLRRGQQTASPAVPSSQKTAREEEVASLIASFRRRITSRIDLRPAKGPRDDIEVAVGSIEAQRRKARLAPCALALASFGVRACDDIALHRLSIPQRQASPFPLWPAFPALAAIAVQNAPTADVEEGLARNLVNILAKTKLGHDLVAAHGGLEMLLANLGECRPSWQFSRNKPTFALLAAAVMLFTYGPVLSDSAADLVDLTKPILAASSAAHHASQANATGATPAAPSGPEGSAPAALATGADGSQSPAGPAAAATSGAHSPSQTIAASSSSSSLSTPFVEKTVLATLVQQLERFAALPAEAHILPCISSLAMAIWSLARSRHNASALIAQRTAVGALLAIVNKVEAYLVASLRSAAARASELRLSALENLEASLNALWILASYGVSATSPAALRAQLLEDLLLHGAVQRASAVVDALVATCSRGVRTNSLPIPGPAVSILQRIALQSLSFLWVVVDVSPALLVVPVRANNAWMLHALYKCSFSGAMCPEVRERSTNLLAHLTHRIRTLKDPRVIACRDVLKRDLSPSALLKLAVCHLDDDTELLRTTGATLFARLPLTEEDQKVFKASGRGAKLIDLATTSSHRERRAALLALLKYAESDAGQKEIAKLGFYRLLVGCWVAADEAAFDLQDLLSALLQLVAENTANRPKLYQAELRAKEIAGWAPVSDKAWQTALAQAADQDGSDVSGCAIPTSCKDVRRSFECWLANVEADLKGELEQVLVRQSTSPSSPSCQSEGPRPKRAQGPRCGVLRPCAFEAEDLRKAMHAFREHRMALETAPRSILSPDHSPLWPFRSLIFPTAAAAEAPASQQCRPESESTRASSGAVVLRRTEQDLEPADIDAQLRAAKRRAWAITNKTPARQTPKAPPRGAFRAPGSKSKSSPSRKLRAASSGRDQAPLSPWKVALVVNESPEDRIWAHESVAGPGCRHSRFTSFSRSQFAQANQKLSHRLRAPVKTLWRGPQAALPDADPWAPSIKDTSRTMVTVERETFCFAPADGAAGRAEETPAEYIARALRRPSASQRPKREKMALFGHVDGARIHTDLALFEAPEGRIGFVFYSGPRNVIDLYLDFDQLGAPPAPTSIVSLGRIATGTSDGAAARGERQPPPGAARDSDKVAPRPMLSARQVLDALPGIPRDLEPWARAPRDILHKLRPALEQGPQRAETPLVYSQNHEDGARVIPVVLGEPMESLARTERGQAETGVCWTPEGCILDDTLPLAVRVPGRVLRVLEGEPEEDEGPQLCMEAFDGRRAFLDENPIAKACASVDWELNMQKKGFREFLDHFDPEDADITRDLVIGASPLLLSIYRFYCALTPQNPFAMLPPSFLRLLTDIRVLGRKESTFTHVCMNLFIRVASMVPDEQDAKVRRLNEQCDPLGLKRCRRLMRHEFLDVILRIAHAKYCDADNQSIAAAFDHFLQAHVVRYLGPETVLDFDSWRVRYLYTEEVSTVIQSHRPMLMQWFTEMAGTAQRSLRWGGLEKERLAFQEWNQGLRRVGLFTANFTIRESTFAFVLSTTNVVNWVAEWEPMIALSYQDFLEALGRVAELITVPTPAQLEFFGVENIVEFYSLMERTNLWSAVDDANTHAQTRLKLWQTAADGEDGRGADAVEPDTRSLAEKLMQFLELLESRNSIDERREAELSFWVSKKKRRGSQDCADGSDGSGPGEDASGAPKAKLEGAKPRDGDDGMVNDGKSSSSRSGGSTARRRSTVGELFTLDEDEMGELGEEDVAAVSDDLETFEISTATKLHEVWRSKRKRLPDGTFEPRIKVINNVEYDIANLEFHQLPDYFKLENLLASHAACESIRRCWNQTMGSSRAERLQNLRKTLKTPNFIEKASAEQHDNWLKRNSKLPWVTDEQRGRYEDLSEGEKQKDRDIVLVGIEVYLETQFSDSS